MALVELSSRTLPTITVDLKVARLIKTFKDPYEAIETARQKLLKELPIAEAPDPDRFERVRDLRFKEEVLDIVEELPDVPDRLMIQEADLPKAIKTGRAEENRGGLADILVNLGPCYEWPEEEETEPAAPAA